MFAILTDSAANLSSHLLNQYNISAIPLPCFVDGKEYRYQNIEKFNDKEFYTSIKNGAIITTSQVTPHTYTEAMRPLLEKGKDVLFVGLSSGVSGSFSSAKIAKQQIEEEYPDRKIMLLDSLAAGLGEGLVALQAAKCRAKDMTIEETYEETMSFRDRLCQIFFVDDLMHLKRTGRLSNAGAIVGTLLGIKPLLKGNEEGKIVACEKIRGRKNAICALAEKYFSLVKNAITQTIAISYTDCKEDAEHLAKLLKEKLPPKDIIILKHEPSTGSHLGPGSLALFFESEAGVRLK